MPRRPPRPALLLPLVLLGLVAAGCDSNDADDDEMLDPMMLQGDVQFIDFFAPHHAMAVEMADMVLARGADAEVKAMAQRMKAAQQAEIQTMRAARQALTGTAESPMMENPHGEMDMAEMMNASGTALDRLFLRNMIPHHAGGVMSAHNATGLTRSDIQALRQTIYDTQAEEVGEMKAMLDRLGG